MLASLALPLPCYCPVTASNYARTSRVGLTAGLVLTFSLLVAHTILNERICAFSLLDPFLYLMRISQSMPSAPRAQGPRGKKPFLHQTSIPTSLPLGARLEFCTTYHACHALGSLTLDWSSKKLAAHVRCPFPLTQTINRSSK